MKNSITIFREDFNDEQWKGYCCAAAVPTNAGEITIYFDECDVEYEDATAEITVTPKVAARIRTAKDLNDFFAFMERDVDVVLTYTWPENEQVRINELMNDILYQPGVFDEDNVNRILWNNKKGDDSNGEN